MVKVMTVFGTRPEAIKMAPVVRALKSKPTKFDVKVTVTGQHREMLDQVLEFFQITPDHDLDIMRHGQTLTDITSRVLSGLEKVISAESPDIVLVHGDTTTTFAASLAAFYQQVAVGHVEAGLRSYDLYNPFPEEMNRRLTGALATFHFAPTQSAAEHLAGEGVSRSHIFLTGNTVIDALLGTVRDDYIFRNPVLKNLDFAEERVILMTTHRRENWGLPMRRIFTAVRQLIQSFPDVRVVFPVHRNPRIREVAESALSDLPRVNLIEPPAYEEFVNLMARAYFLLTDSGGLQEEAPSLEKPVLVLRDTTERPEGVQAGTALLVGTDTGRIVKEATRLLTDQQAYSTMAKAPNPYGDGQAAERIAKILWEQRELLRVWSMAETGRS
ncbi:MAG: UDP-N-acetylglucosamine 2-epimerase (non-hydrolyzing) [Firmicutes bacterium]|nr:UDP-N-acetylglucosamine 2-epimerase (non-hydrolyzing) [Bacillota bacterium]